MPQAGADPLTSLTSLETNDNVPLAHSLILWRLTSTAILPIIVFLSSTLPFGLHYIIDGVAVLLKLNILVLRWWLVLSYLLCESGDIWMSVLEPAHSCQVTSIVTMFSLFHYQQMTSVMRLTCWVFRYVRPRKNFLAKLCKIFLLSRTSYLSNYELYIVLRCSHFSLVHATSDSGDLQFLYGLLQLLYVVWTLGFHSPFAMIVLAMQSVFLVYIKAAQLSPRAAQILTTPPDLSEDRSLLARTIASIWYACTVCFTLWEFFVNDGTHAPEQKSDGEEASDYYGNWRQGTETRLSRAVSKLLDALTNAGLARCRPDVFSNSAQHYCTSPLTAVTLSRILQMSLGTRRIRCAGNALIEGSIQQLALSYTPLPERMESLLSFFLRRTPGAVVSYRHCETMEASCTKIERLVRDSGCEVLWADVFLNEVRNVEGNTGFKWLKVGLEPYMYMPVIREQNIEDGEDRLWLSLEKRLQNTMDVRDIITGNRSFPSPSLSIVYWLYYITGRCLSLKVHEDHTEDIVDMAKAGFEAHGRMLEFFGENEFIFGISIGMYLAHLDIFPPHQQLIEDGKCTIEVLVSEEVLAGIVETLQFVQQNALQMYRVLQCTAGVPDDIQHNANHDMVSVCIRDHSVRFVSGILDVDYRSLRNARCEVSYSK